MKRTFSIKGMHCASCVKAVEQSLRKVEGVSRATVDLAAEKATVVYDQDKVDVAKLVSAVSSVGYQVLVSE